MQVGQKFGVWFFLRQCMSIGGRGDFVDFFCSNFLFSRMRIVDLIFAFDSSNCGEGMCEMRPGRDKLFCVDWWDVWKVVCVQRFFCAHEAIAIANGFFFVIEFSQRVF